MMRIKLLNNFALIYILIFSVVKLLASDSIVYSGSLDNRQDIQSFILIGDTQRASNWEFGREKNDEVRPIIFKKIADDNPAFIIHLGDFGFMGSNEDDWTAFDNFASDIRKNNIPVFPTLGNHEYFGCDDKALKNYFSHFPHINKQKWYSFKFNGIGFVVLNSNFDELESIEKEEQNSWYVKILNELQSDSSVKSIIIACHHAPFTNSTVVSPDENVRKFFVEPMLEIPKAKLFFTGHCHSYEHFEKSGKHFVVTGGGSGPRQKLREKPIYRDTFKGGQIRVFHYCKVTIHNNGLLVQMIYIDDEVLRQASENKKWEVGQEFFVKY